MSAPEFSCGVVLRTLEGFARGAWPELPALVYPALVGLRFLTGGLGEFGRFSSVVRVDAFDGARDGWPVDWNEFGFKRPVFDTRRASEAGVGDMYDGTRSLGLCMRGAPATVGRGSAVSVLRNSGVNVALDLAAASLVSGGCKPCDIFGDLPYLLAKSKKASRVGVVSAG